MWFIATDARSEPSVTNCCKNCLFEKTENKQKEAGFGLF